MSRPVSETCPVCGTPGRIVGGDEGTQHFEPEAAWVSPAVTRRAEIAERKALAALLGESWLAYDLANDAYLAKDVPRPGGSATARGRNSSWKLFTRHQSSGTG